MIAPIIVLDGLEHTPFVLTPQSGYQIIRHPAILECLVFHNDAFICCADSPDEAQRWIDVQEAVRE